MRNTQRQDKTSCLVSVFNFWSIQYMQNSLNVEHHPPQKFNRYDTQIVRFEPSVFKQPAPLQMFIEERQCSICNSADTTVVFLLCKHQLSCRVCWESAKKGERAVHNTNERLRIQLAGAGVKRVARIQRASAQRSAGPAHDRARRRALHGSTRRPTRLTKSSSSYHAHHVSSHFERTLTTEQRQ